MSANSYRYSGTHTHTTQWFGGNGDVKIKRVQKFLTMMLFYLNFNKTVKNANTATTGSRKKN